MKRWLPVVVLLAASVLALTAAVRMTACAPAERDVSPPAATAADDPAPPGSTEETEGPAEETEGPADGGSPIAPIGNQTVVVYYPAANRSGLVGEKREIFVTATPGDRAKQIVADLISGPLTDRALRAFPPGTRLRQIFVVGNGDAFVDFSADLAQGLGGGSMQEIITVYSVVDSIVLNVPEIRRVGILINGEPIESLSGHLDLRRPLPADRSLIVGGPDSRRRESPGSVARLAPAASDPEAR